MVHLPNLIQDLGLILMAAAAVSLLCKKLNQPVVLGYLIAGFFVGPHFDFFPTVKDTQSISIWAEIGVIFMLFGLGLEFSFKKLTQVGKSASITASFEIIFMLGVGYLAGQLLGWSKMDSLFLGGILSISSTTIIVRAFDEIGLKGRNFVSLVFGVLIVEDLIAILLLVLLSSVAVTQSLSGSALIFSSLRLGFFLVLWFLLGIYILPVLLKKSRNLLTDETLLVVSIGLCLMMVIVASHVGFSPALGAFVMGSILAETSKGPKIEHLIHPVKGLFSAVFFVSVGMLIDLTVLQEYFGTILLMTVLTIVGKLFSTTIGALVSGRSFKTSVQTGMSLAQIGEFSFIIATLGVTLKVTSDFLYPIAVAVSAVTTFTTPYLIKFADPFAEWLEGRLPDRVRISLTNYQTAMSTNSSGNILTLVWNEYGIKILLNSVIVIGIASAMGGLVLPQLGEEYRHGLWGVAACLVTLLAAGPFLWAILFGAPMRSEENRVTSTERLKKLQLGISIIRFIIGCALVGFILSYFASIMAFSGVLLLVVLAISSLFFSRFSEPLYKKIEERFIFNLTANERAELEQKAKIPELAPWNATLAAFQLSQSSPLIAKTLQESRMKEEFGVTVAMIERGEKRILAPTRYDHLLPGDTLFLIGTDEQLATAREVIERKPSTDLSPLAGNFGLASLILTTEDPFIGKPIRECGLREAVSGLIVGLEREGQRYLSPDSSMQLNPGDLIWLVGNQDLIRGLRTTK